MLNSLKSLVDKDIFSLLTPKRQLVGLDIGSTGMKLIASTRFFRSMFVRSWWPPSRLEDVARADRRRRGNRRHVGEELRPGLHDGEDGKTIGHHWAPPVVAPRGAGAGAFGCSAGSGK